MAGRQDMGNGLAFDKEEHFLYLNRKNRGKDGPRFKEIREWKDEII